MHNTHDHNHCSTSTMSTRITRSAAQADKSAPQADKSAPEAVNGSSRPKAKPKGRHVKAAAKTKVKAPVVKSPDSEYEEDVPEPLVEEIRVPVASVEIEAHASTRTKTQRPVTESPSMFILNRKMIMSLFQCIHGEFQYAVTGNTVCKLKDTLTSLRRQSVKGSVTISVLSKSWERCLRADLVLTVLKRVGPDVFDLRKGEHELTNIALATILARFVVTDCGVPEEYFNLQESENAVEEFRKGQTACVDMSSPLARFKVVTALVGKPELAAGSLTRASIMTKLKNIHLNTMITSAYVIMGPSSVYGTVAQISGRFADFVGV